MSWCHQSPCIPTRWWRRSLAASTYPDQVVAANSWLQANSKLNTAAADQAGEMGSPGTRVSKR